MIRRMTLAALLLAACGGDSKDDDQPAAEKDAAGGEVQETGKDASTAAPKDAGNDAQPAAKPDQVTNAGEACKSANACEGEAPTCVTNLDLAGQQIPFPGGYCSARCSVNVECGSAGECPVGESLKTLVIPLIPPALLQNAIPSHCYLPCTSDAECRMSEGYRCATILNALSEGAGTGLNIGGFDVSSFLSGPIKDSKYCLPPPPPMPEAGTPDAGSATDAGAADASNASDAGQSDAAQGDV